MILPDLDQLTQLMQGSGNSSLIQSILLILIWLNVRSLKKAMVKLEESNDHRIGALEVKIEKHEGRLTALEANKGT